MMTVITRVRLRAGEEQRWDAAFRERIATVRDQPGWIGVQLCVPADEPSERVVVGTWESRAHWEAWHGTEPFGRTADAMAAAEAGDHHEVWHEVGLDEHR